MHGMSFDEQSERSQTSHDLSQLEAVQLSKAVLNTITHLEKDFKKEEVVSMLNTPDCYGACLIHYLTALNEN